MVQYNKIIKNKKKGFTLVELMVVLAITAILAALVGGGLIAYTRLARFEKNEANARTLFQTAQISLTRMETAGELDAFRRQVMEEGSTGDHFQNDVTVTDADGKTLVSRTKTELNQNVAALYYDRTGAAAGNHNALVKELLGDYIYDASLLNASICVEIDVQSGQVYSVFYDTKSDKLRFNQDGATNIYDRSYDHRRNDTLVGYYSAEDRVNVVQLVQTKLKVKNPRLTNGETLTLSWSGNSSLGDLDTSYTATAYAAGDTGDNRKPLFTITIKRDTAGAADDNKQVITKMPVTIYTYDNAGQRTETKKELYFPLSYNKGSFVLTLDAMADAALLRACENDEVAATSLYSITRLLNDPKDIYIAMRAEPRENYSDTYTASKEETTNEENTLLAKGGTAVTADLKYFRHLYNLRWSADWKIDDKGTYTLTPQASNSTGLNWTGGGVTVYCASGERYPAAKVPSLNDPVAWPTIPELGEKIELTSKTTVLTTKTTRVPILNLQLSSKSVAKTGKAEKDELADHYVGLIGENKGKISYITLRDPDIQVNVKTETVDAGTLPNEKQLKLTATKFVTALAKDDENWRDVRAVGALCGVNTGTLENCALTRGTNSSTSALVAAALAFDNTTTATQRKAQTQNAGGKSYTYYTDEPRGIGGLVGVAIPKAESVMQNLTVASDVTVAGLLVDENTKSVTDIAADQQAEKARYAAAAAGPGEKNSLWRSVGVGGVFGTVDATQMKTNGDTNIVNNGFVTGNGFTGGVVGNLFTTGANTSAPSLTGLRNNGTVSAGANYKGDTAGDARSLVLGQFFGGIAGYGRGVTLQGCESVTRSDLTETQLKEQVKAGFDETGTLTDASPLKGDFVGGLVGYGKEIVLNGCKTGKGYVLGSRFVGGLAGGFTGSGVQQNDTNSSDVFGSRYVGGIVSVNGSNSQISGMTNTGLVAAFGQNAAYVGGIVGVNDAGWGGSKDPTATATVRNCANRMSGDNATDTRRINLLKGLSGCADYVGGIAGCNGKNGVVTWDENGTPTLGAILYGNNYVGGVAGYNDENATISNTSGQNLTISGQIVAAGKAVGGMIGLNCASTLPSATVAVSRVAGQQLVGGVIGANLPVGGFTVTGGAFNTHVASGRVEADAVAGGIIGYNRLLTPKRAGVTLEALLPTIDQNTGVLTDSTDAQTADGTITLANFQNKLNLQADIYVGGIVGANDANTKLTIQKATNGATQNALSVGGLNPSNNGAFKGGVSLNALAGGRYDFDDVHGALAGGIIGYATPNTVLKNCINYGTVAHKCAAGGFAGWNEGMITGGSMAASLGNREAGYTYLGGVAGVNGGLIQSAYPAKDCAVRGDSYVGGIAGVNLGVDAAASKGLIICTGDNSSTGTVEANQYAGGVAGANVGSVSLSGKLQSSVTATGYAGGVAGINTKNGIYTGRICGAENPTGAVGGSVTAANYAGGVAGTNSAEITRVDNYASVRASTKYAGGIAGENYEGGKISACVHAQNQVYATNGEAGGIAGNNNKDALIENVQVSAAVTAANGTAGGVTATNFGIIGQETGPEDNSSVSGCTITGTSESIGAVAAYNGKGATIRNVKLAENVNVRFSTPAVTIGGLAGMNDGAVTGCRVENGALALNDGLRAGTNTVTLGGAVGCTTEHGTVSSTNVLLDLTQNLDKYTNLGGVAGQNDGTLDQCTYSGTMGGNADTDGLVSVGARSTGSTVGGIAGLNNNTITGCEVKYIKLQVSGISNITTTQTADEKLASASHVGGIAGRNNVEIVNSYVATERSGNAGSIITARYGFVGGVAGSNNGTIKGSGSKTVQTDLMPELKKRIADGDTNAIVAALRGNPVNGTGATVSYVSNFVDLKGVDTVTNKGYTNVYSDTGLAANDLLVGLRGSNKDMNNLASGHLGGITGFNGLNGSISSTASGKWFVYADNAARDDTTVGGIVGQNESNVTGTSALDTVVNCAAVRRFSRRTFWKTGNNATQRGDISQSDANDRDDVNYYDSTNRFNVQVGGIICNQNNRSGDRWTLTNCINFGSVYNSRSGNAGGVISLWTNYGGTLQNCYNFGDLKTNFNDGGSDCGTMGGIVAYYDAPVSNTSVNVLSCQNHGSMKSSIDGWSSANDIGGIFGKVQMKNATDIMTIDLYDCVNGSTVSIQARSMAVGIFAYLGPWDGVDNPNVSSVKKGNGYNGNAQFKTIPYVTINIDRCRNFTTNMTTQTRKGDNDSANNGKYYWIAGIVGSRSMGGYSVAPTTITNCFSVVKDDWHPVAYDKRSSTELTMKDGTVVYGEHIEGHNNYYIDSGAAFANSYKKIQGQSQTATGVIDRTLTRTTTGLSTSINWGTQNSNFTERQENTKSGSRRLFIGKDTGGGTDDAYFAMLPTSSDGKQISYDITKLTGSTGYIGVKTGQSFGEKSTRRYIYDANGGERGQLLLVYGENAQTTKDNRKGEPDNEDITDEVIQNYYKYVLDSTKPAKPGEIHVKASQVQDADNNVYGRYEVTWDEPNDTTASPAAYYRVEILPCNDADTVAPDAVPYLKADVYQRSYTFVADKAWTGYFVVRVTPYNTNNDPNQPDNPNTSGVQTFMHALPKPELEVRLVKRSEFNWNECTKVDGNEEFKYEQILVLKNYEDYPKDENWTVTVTRNGVTNPYTFSRQNGKKYIRIAWSIGVTKTFTALATPAAGSTSYLRSAEYKVETYVPSQWRDVNKEDAKKNEDGLPAGTLTKAENATEYVTCTGQSAENFTATVTFGFTPTSADPTHGNPTYRVMLLAKYLGNDTVNGRSLNGQYITLAAREGIVTETPVTFNLNSLPSDAMSNYTDFLVIAVPITSGKGDVTTRWDATAEEVSAAIASHANETNDTDKEIWWKNGYEIVRTGEHSYTYAHLTPLCFSDVNRDKSGWAEQATVTTPQIIFKQLNLNVLKAPTLDKNTEGKVDEKTNELTYTFNWTQENIGTETPTYSIKLYGLLTDANGNVTGQEQIALKDGVNLANEVQRSGSNSFTLPVNVDTMLANGSDSWRYDKVRLEVTRVAAAGTDEIGASAVADYSVKQRLPGISAPSSITRVNGETDNADALLYTVSWSPSDNARIDHYDLCVVDADDKTVLTLPTTDNVGSLTLDLEQYQGKALRFRVIARRKDDSCFDGPDGALSQPEAIVRRAAAPTVTASSFAPDSPNQETFLNDLKLNMTLEKAAQGNVYFTGYIFSSVDNYNTIADLAKAWQNTLTGQAKYEAQQELTKKLDEMLNSGDAELVIPKDSRTVGGSASANDTTASYTFVPDGNGFTLTPDHAKQYLLPAVRVMPTDGRTASNWFYILQQDAANAQLPAITLDAPVDAAEPERALGNAVYTQEVNLYSDPEFKSNRGTAPLKLRRFTVEWTAVNKYTQADGTVRNLTDSYTFTVTPLDSKTKQPYSITVTTYDRDVKDADGNITHKRGEIETVTKTYNDETTELEKQTDETRIWYDLSVEPVYDKDNNLTGWKSQPYDVTGTVEKDGGTLYYKAQTVPMLELVQEDGAEPVYRITLPELQEKVQDDSLALQKFTASVTLQTLAHSIGDDKTVASDSVKVPVNETNTADAAEDAQSMDSAESVAPAETAESTAAESAPASVPPVLMRARAALPVTTPETAAAPDETDAAETAPLERTETSDAS